MQSTTDIDRLLSERIHLYEISKIAQWAAAASSNIEYLLHIAQTDNQRSATNALWILTHLKTSRRQWFQARQNELIDLLIKETHPSKKRMLLQLLREQEYAPESIRTDFLDYCLTKINSQCEPYAIRAFSIYCAYKLSQAYPDLLSELNQHLTLLTNQPLTPGLKTALCKTKSKIQYPPAQTPRKKPRKNREQ